MLFIVFLLDFGTVVLTVLFIVFHFTMTLDSLSTSLILLFLRLPNLLIILNRKRDNQHVLNVL